MRGAAPVQQDEDAQWGIRELQVPAHMARLQPGLPQVVCVRVGIPGDTGTAGGVQGAGAGKMFQKTWRTCSREQVLCLQLLQRGLWRGGGWSLLLSNKR